MHEFSLRHKYPVIHTINNVLFCSFERLQMFAMVQHKNEKLRNVLSFLISSLLVVVITKGSESLMPSAWEKQKKADFTETSLDTTPSTLVQVKLK